MSAPAPASANASRQPSQSHTKRFVFGSPTGSVEVLVPEASYSFYTWPSAPVLAWFLWSQRASLVGKRVLEIGAGTALPGILAAKCGAIVTLTDSATLPKSLRHVRRCCEANSLAPGRDVQVAGLTWGLFPSSALRLGPFDLIVGSDCFYDPAAFEDVLATASLYLSTPRSKFVVAYQERSSDWSIEAPLKKWNLKASLIDLDSVGALCGIDFDELAGGHSIHLIEIVPS